MKKLALYSLTIIACNTYIMAIEEKKDPIAYSEDSFKNEQPIAQVLFFLSTMDQRQDGHIYGALSRLHARTTAKIIHNRLEKAIKDKQNNIEEVGTSLNKEHDAQLVNACAHAEKSLRNSGNLGTITIKDPTFLNIFGRSSTISAQTFYKEACPCEIYETLTNEQLDVLEKSTAPEYKGWFSFFK